MRIEQISPLLARTELFADLDSSALASLAQRAVPRTYKRGSYVFHSGDAADCLFVLTEGLLKVTVSSEEGDEMVLVTLRPPATFGELALADGRPRSATVEVMETSTVLVLTRATLVELMQQHPSITGGLLRSLGTLIRRLTVQTSDFVFLDLPGRVAKLLCGFIESQAAGSGGEVVLDLRITQGDLARMVGGSRQSVNQILRSLENRDLVEIDGRTIVVKRPDLLRQRAGL